MSKYIIKYPMKSKTEKPRFNYLERSNDSLDYYLYYEFDDALNKVRTMSLTERGHITCLYEPYFNTITREWYGQKTFTAYDGIVKYDKHARADLHLAFYVNAGEWLNPDIKLDR